MTHIGVTYGYFVHMTKTGVINAYLDCSFTVLARVRLLCKALLTSQEIGATPYCHLMKAYLAFLNIPPLKSYWLSAALVRHVWFIC